jgi:hypothetical protein
MPFDFCFENIPAFPLVQNLSLVQHMMMIIFQSLLTTLEVSGFFEAVVALVKSNHISLTCNYQNKLVIELRVDNKVIIIIIIKSPKPILTKVS